MTRRFLQFSKFYGIKVWKFRKYLVKRQMEIFFLIWFDLNVFFTVYTINAMFKYNQSTIEFINTLRSIHMEAIFTNRGAGMYGDMRELFLPNFDRSFLIYFYFNWRNFMKLRIWPQPNFKTFRSPCSKAFTSLPKLCFQMVLPDK